MFLDVRDAIRGCRATLRPWRAEIGRGRVVVAVLRDRCTGCADTAGSRVAARGGMRGLQLAALFVLAACGPETTSFRTVDASDPDRPSAALVDVRDAARVDVWSNGGYFGSSGDPMTHVGFEIRNTSSAPIVFDSDALRLVVFGAYGVPLPPARFSAVTPLGPAQRSIGPGATTTLEAYFVLPVRPRMIDTMRVRWSLKIGDAGHDVMSSFTRDDESMVLDPPRAARPVPPST